MLHLIAAVANDGGIGKDNQLLCHISADLKRFKQLTMGHTIIMGRKTFESLPGILPGRPHIVLTSKQDYDAGSPHVTVVHNMEALYGLLEDTSDYFVIGGASLYAACLDRADTLYLTEIHASFPADTFFPAFDKTKWHAAEEEYHAEDEKNPYAYTFVHYVRNVR